MKQRSRYVPPPPVEWTTLLTEVLTTVGPQLNALRESHYAFDLSILGLASMPTPDGLRAAWRATATRTHPQHGGTDEAFVRAKAAYDRLTPVVDAIARRKAADELRAAGAAAQAPAASSATEAVEPTPTANVDVAPAVSEAPPQESAPKLWEISDNATLAIVMIGSIVMLTFMVYVLTEATR